MDIASITAASQNPYSTTTGTRDLSGNQTLNASDFLDLLITQMTHQDPLDPMEDKEFMAQMAQFSSLEEMTKLNTTMTDFVQSQQAQSSSAYLGREVTILADNGEHIDGLVSAVNRDAEGKVTVTVDGNDYAINQIQSVRLPTTEA